MAESTYEEHGTSGEFVDPFCDTCFEGKGLNVRVYGYCKECFQFMCCDCHLVHSTFPLARGHTVLRGSSMPQSQADKPPKFDFCDCHPKLLKNEFCSEHKILICSSCSSTNHNKCFVGSVDNICKTVNVCEIDSLYNDIKTVQDQARSVHSSLETNMQNLEEQKNTILKEARTIYDKVVSKVNKLFKDLQSEIETTYQSQELLISQQQERIDLLVNRLESVLTDSQKSKGKPIDTRLFLKVQDLVTDTRQITDEFRTVNKSLHLISLAFKPGKAVQDFLLPSATFGSVSKSEAKYDKDIVVKDAVFPCSQYKPLKAAMVLPQQTSSSGRTTGPLSKITVTKNYIHNIKLKDDENCWYVTGLAITKDRKRIIVDFCNRKVKMFSHDMMFLSSVLIPNSRPRDIAVISERKAAVTADYCSLVILDISGSKLSIKTTRHLSYDVKGICRYNGKLCVTCFDIELSVKLIDQTGRVYWSVSSSQQGYPLFSEPWYVSSPGDGRSSTVVVTDKGNNTLTLLNGDTGEIISGCQLKERNGLKGVTTDSDGNMFICCQETSEVTVLSSDLSEEKIILSKRAGLIDFPLAIVYDAHQLIISSSISDWANVQIFQIS